VTEIARRDHPRRSVISLLRSSPADPRPFVATWLFATFNSTFPIGIYVVICAIISLTATALLPDYTKKDISTEAHYEEPL